MRLANVVLMIVLLGALLVAQAGDIVGYAIVRDDASLRIQGRTVRLFGIYIPSTDRSCLFSFRPTRCAPRAALALEVKIRSFVRCQEMGVNSDGSLSAICWVNYSSFREGEDLAAYLLSQGWAVALPDAPFEYHALEKIARHRSIGIWGFPADRIRRPGEW